MLQRNVTRLCVAQGTCSGARAPRDCPAGIDLGRRAPGEDRFARRDDDVGGTLDAAQAGLDALGDVHGVADQRVVDAAGKADIADDGRTRMVADLQPW